MSAETRDDAVDRVARLRHDFDASFAIAPPSDAPDTESFLAIRVGGTLHALRLRGLSGIAVTPSIVSAPSRAAHLLGFAGLRGGVVVVFSLETLLGRESTRGGARWLALGPGPDVIGLAFPVLEGFVRVPRGEVRRGGDTANAAHKEYVQLGTVAAPIVDAASLGESLKLRAGNAGRDKER